jgi:hypothetical protein
MAKVAAVLTLRAQIIMEDGRYSTGAVPEHATAPGTPPKKLPSFLPEQLNLVVLLLATLLSIPGDGYARKNNKQDIPANSIDSMLKQSIFRTLFPLFQWEKE